MKPYIDPTMSQNARESGYVDIIAMNIDDARNFMKKKFGHDIPADKMSWERPRIINGRKIPGFYRFWRYTR